MRTTIKSMRYFLNLGLAALLLAAPLTLWPLHPAGAQPQTGPLRVEWEVKNRFRLFRAEADFQRHIAAYRNDGVLGEEDRLARQSDGRGWARDTVERLCVDRAGQLQEACDRDGVRENYLAPRDHRVGVVLAGPLPAGNLSCAWSFDDGQGTPRSVNGALRRGGQAARRLWTVDHGEPSTSSCPTARRSASSATSWCATS